LTEAIRRDLEAYLGTRVISVEPVPEGHSGFTYYVQLEGERLILRLPPPGARIAGPADVVRQGRIMAALNAAGLPTPAARAISPEPAVDGRPFILMEVVEGARIEQVDASVPSRQLAGSAVDVLRRLHGLPPERTGIGGEEPVSLEAEMMRWAWLMERAPTELTGRAPALGALLAERRPPAGPPALVHGDYHYGNLLFREGRVVAVLDWEIAQLGQPLLDLGCLCVVAQAGRLGAEGAIPGGGLVELPMEEVIALYGADPGGMDWYLALTYYKYAAIFGYNLMLHRRGKRPDPIYEQRTGTIVSFIEDGIRVLGG